MPSYGAESNLFAYLKAKSQGPGGMLFNRGILSLSSAALLLLLGVMMTGLDAEPFETIGIVCISFAVLMVILALRFFSASSERSREWTDRFVRAYFHPGHESVPHRVLGNLGDTDTPSPQEQPMRSLPVGMKPPPYDSVVALGLFPPAECAYMFLQPPPTYDFSQQQGVSGHPSHPLGLLTTPEEPPAYQSAESLPYASQRSQGYLGMSQRSQGYLGMSQRSQCYLGHPSHAQPSSSVRMFKLHGRPAKSFSTLNTLPIALLSHGQLVNAQLSHNNNNNKHTYHTGNGLWTVTCPSSQRSLDALITPRQEMENQVTSLPHSATLPVIPVTCEDFCSRVMVSGQCSEEQMQYHSAMGSLVSVTGECVQNPAMNRNCVSVVSLEDLPENPSTQVNIEESPHLECVSENNEDTSSVVLSTEIQVLEVESDKYVSEDTDYNMHSCSSENATTKNLDTEKLEGNPDDSLNMNTLAQPLKENFASGDINSNKEMYSKGCSDESQILTESGESYTLSGTDGRGVDRKNNLGES